MRGISLILAGIQYPSGGFAGEYGGTLSDPYAPGIDYGNVNFSRRNRFLTTFLYELPFGKSKMLLNGANGFLTGWWTDGNSPACCCFRAALYDGQYAHRSLWLRVQRFQLYRWPGGHNFWSQPDRGTIDRPVDQSRCFRQPGQHIGRFGDPPAGNVSGPALGGLDVHD